MLKRGFPGGAAVQIDPFYPERNAPVPVRSFSLKVRKFERRWCLRLCHQNADYDAKRQC
jgi:hypothetical protein